MAASSSLEIQWYPDSMRCDLVRGDQGKEYVFHFKIKELKKKEAQGNFEIQSTTRSFTFLVNAGDKPMLKCKVSNLPEDIETKKLPETKIDDGRIQVFLKKTTENNWDNLIRRNESWKFPPPSEIQ
ncbi:uncharacterized protein [Watersipora subatra]|uniref:uncharacterized protein isoform X2 n=2 Tax=Watersipora subatra TaxID=2589382 RepID=UPI00355B4998